MSNATEQQTSAWGRNLDDGELKDFKERVAKVERFLASGGGRDPFITRSEKAKATNVGPHAGAGIAPNIATASVREIYEACGHCGEGKCQHARVKFADGAVGELYWRTECLSDSAEITCDVHASWDDLGETEKATKAKKAADEKERQEKAAHLAKLRAAYDIWVRDGQIGQCPLASLDRETIEFQIAIEKGSLDFDKALHAAAMCGSVAAVKMMKDWALESSIDDIDANNASGVNGASGSIAATNCAKDWELGASINDIDANNASGVNASGSVAAMNCAKASANANDAALIPANLGAVPFAMIQDFLGPVAPSAPPPGKGNGTQQGGATS